MDFNPEIHNYYHNLTYPGDMLSIIRNGFPKTSSPKKITIIGAGMAGLVAASLLKDAGHYVTILEGNDRVGGRIYTVREPFTPGNYLDMGAMRFPETHELVKEYTKKFNLPTNRFINTSQNDLLNVNGILATAAYYEKHPDVFQFPLPQEEQGKTARELFLIAVESFLNLYNNSNPKQQEILRKKFDHYSFDDFLRFNPFGNSLSSNAVRKVRVILGIEGFPEYAFVDILLDIVATVFNPDMKFYEITGGNDQLPKSLFPQLEENIIFNQKVNQIFQKENAVTVTARDLSTGENHAYDADYLISAVPYSVFQFIDVHPYHSFSFEKWKVIQELNFVSSVKVGLEFKSKFWQGSGVGNIITDFPAQYTYNPSHHLDVEGPGVLLASYSWGHNAMLWVSLDEEERIREALNGLYKIYGEQVYTEFLQGTTFSWSESEFSAGCFTLFTPNQRSDFEEAIYLPEGRVHFAGEHTSSFHGWTEGAIESGIRAAYEIYYRV